MDEAEIDRLHREHWRPGYGSVTVAEMVVIAQAIAEHRPESFLEIGTASGLSAGLVARCLDAHGGSRLVTVDHDDTFFGDPGRENGFLLPSIYPHDNVRVVRRTFETALEVPWHGEEHQMAFVDANHQHPWPILDTLCLFPVMSGPRLVFHHDLNLFRKQPLARGLGPKVLHDQFPPHLRRRASANDGNLFSVSLDVTRREMEEIAADALSIPWTLTKTLTDQQVEAVRGVLREHYDPALLRLFDDRTAVFNVPTKRLYRTTAGS